MNGHNPDIVSRSPSLISSAERGETINLLDSDEHNNDTLNRNNGRFKHDDNDSDLIQNDNTSQRTIVGVGGTGGGGGGFGEDQQQQQDLSSALSSSSATAIETAEGTTTETEQINVLQQSKYYVFKSKCFIGFLAVSIIMIILVCVGVVIALENHNSYMMHTINLRSYDDLPMEQQRWYDSARQELKSALKVRIHSKPARNIILFIGDGMGPNTVTATRIQKYGEIGLMSWEHFPHMGLLKTYCNDKQVPDSTATATALFSGVKVNYETAGVDSAVPLANCNASLNAEHHVETILKWAQEKGMRTGFVTNTRVMHATPSALYSHTADRRWECESVMSTDDIQMGCKDIARQLIENEPGKNINVIMGGGRQCLIGNVTGTAADPIDRYSCYSKDPKRNLIDKWRIGMEERNENYAVLSNTNELRTLDTDNTDFVLGIFANGHLQYDHLRDKTGTGMPSLREMVQQTIKLLDNKDNNGFLLVVEGGLIDQAHHRGWAHIAVSETSAMDDAVIGAMETLKSEIDDTLIIVTADHTHTLSINGYPKINSDIFGMAGVSPADGVPYTTLSYAVGGPNSIQLEIDKKTGKPKRRDPTKDDTTAYDYVQQAGILSNENPHGGGDVPVYAIGPMAHLFHRVHEQSYVAHVIALAARIGRFFDSRVAQQLLNLL